MMQDESVLEIPSIQQCDYKILYSTRSPEQALGQDMAVAVIRRRCVRLGTGILESSPGLQPQEFSEVPTVMVVTRKVFFYP